LAGGKSTSGGSACQQLINDWLIVEARALLVPINQKQFMLDLMVKFKLPWSWRAQRAGTVNHTLLTLAALHAAELPVHGVVLIGERNRENRETIERFGHVRVIGEIPKLPNLHRTALMQVFMNHSIAPPLRNNCRSANSRCSARSRHFRLRANRELPANKARACAELETYVARGVAGAIKPEWMEAKSGGVASGLGAPGLFLISFWILRC